MIRDKWYVVDVDGGYIELDYVLRTWSHDEHNAGLHRVNGPMVVSIRGDDLMIKQWMIRGQVHRYYGPALNGMFDLEWYYRDSWYIGGQWVR